MATRSERFKRRFLSAPDLNGKPVRLTIDREYMEALKSADGKEQNKSILAFRGTDKELVVNLTNWESLVEITGQDDSARWAGIKVELYPTTTLMAGKRTPYIRIRAVSNPELPLAASGSPPPAPPPAQEEPPLAEPDPGRDFDDPIPFS
jgi:hypothetical protein